MSAFLIVWCLDPNYSKGKLPGTGISPDLRVLPLGSSDSTYQLHCHLQKGTAVEASWAQMYTLLLSRTQ